MLRVLPLSLVVCLSAACGVSHVDDAPAFTVTQQIGPTGGTVELTDGATVVVPAGALSQATSISITVLGLNSVADLPSNLEAAGAAYAFEPHGTRFARAITIEVPFDGSATNLRAIRLDDEQDTTWQTVAASRRTNGTLSMQSTTFSVIVAARPIDAGGVSGEGGVGGTGGISGFGGLGGMGGTGGTGGVGGTIDTTLEQRFPGVTDWNALELVYPTSHSGYDGVHTFQLPIRVRCTAGLPLDSWHSDPPNAVVFDADPNNVNGVLITVVEPVANITIAAVSGILGGTAPLHITVGTPEQWELGNQRFHNGADWSLNILMPEVPPPDTKCSTCHGANSSTGFDILVTPTQTARISDNVLTQIMTTGSKPADVAFRVLPDTMTFGAMTYTNAELYALFHLWDASADQLTGMNLYLRSLTPTGEGCVINPQTGLCENVPLSTECQ